MSDPQCLFCKIAGGEIPAKVIYQDDDVVSFEDINPQAPVHLLVIARTHIPSLDALDEAQESTVGRVVRIAAELARARGLAADGYRLVVNCGPGAGQTVYHLHVHLLGGRGFGWPPG
ncbi:MAG: histidine triad nucleotide-binding protein [Thermoanaerobaculia bacterium]